jgi:5-hydroxyisourate hydrolase-like protein (transthyretin family)
MISLVNLQCAGLKKLGIIPNELEMASGLKAALEQGLFKSFDAFANPKSNPMMLLRLPGEMDKIENILQTLGIKTNVTQITQKLTDAMGTAVQTAKPVFIESLRKMSIKDAAKILITDNPHAATDYFKTTTTENLTRAFIPIVDSTIRLQDADKEYKQIASIYNLIPFLNKKMEENLSGFIAGRAIDVMFLIIAKEESDIRSKYQLRKTDLLKKVFNYAEKEIQRKYQSNK